MEGEHDFTEVTLTRKGVRVDIEYIGEGYSGDYNPDDPEDEPLLRFSVYQSGANHWDQVNDGSYCTCLSAKIDELDKAMVAKIIMDEVYGPISTGTRPKRAMEWLSHLDENDIMRAWDGVKGN